MNIAIASDHPELLKRWRGILEEQYTVILYQTFSVLEGSLQRTDIDMYLIHRSLVDSSFFRMLKDRKWFVLSDTPNDDEACALLRLGAIGYGNAYMTAVRLREAISVILSGRVWIGQQLMLRIIRGANSDNLEQPDISMSKLNLSDREWEVAVLISQGQSNLEIAAALNITERTVKAHLSSIFKKTNTGSRLQLALLIKDELSGNQKQQPQ